MLLLPAQDDRAQAIAAWNIDAMARFIPESGLVVCIQPPTFLKNLKDREKYGSSIHRTSKHLPFHSYPHFHGGTERLQIPFFISLDTIDFKSKLI